MSTPSPSTLKDSSNREDAIKNEETNEVSSFDKFLFKTRDSLPRNHFAFLLKSISAVNFFATSLVKEQMAEYCLKWSADSNANILSAFFVPEFKQICIETNNYKYLKEKYPEIEIDKLKPTQIVQIFCNLSQYASHIYKGKKFGRVTKAPYQDDPCEILDVDFYSNTAYIRVLAKNIYDKNTYDKITQKDRLLSSFNGNYYLPGCAIHNRYFSGKMEILRVNFRNIITYSAHYNNSELEIFFSEPDPEPLKEGITSFKEYINSRIAMMGPYDLSQVELFNQKNDETDDESDVVEIENPSQTESQKSKKESISNRDIKELKDKEAALYSEFPTDFINILSIMTSIAEEVKPVKIDQLNAKIQLLKEQIKTREEISETIIDYEQKSASKANIKKLNTIKTKNHESMVKIRASIQKLEEGLMRLQDLKVCYGTMAYVEREANKLLQGDGDDIKDKLKLNMDNVEKRINKRGVAAIKKNASLIDYEKKYIQLSQKAPKQKDAINENIKLVQSLDYLRFKGPNDEIRLIAKENYDKFINLHNNIVSTSEEYENMIRDIESTIRTLSTKPQTDFVSPSERDAATRARRIFCNVTKNITKNTDFPEIKEFDLPINALKEYLRLTVIATDGLSKEITEMNNFEESLRREQTNGTAIQYPIKACLYAISNSLKVKTAAKKKANDQIKMITSFLSNEDKLQIINQALNESSELIKEQKEQEELEQEKREKEMDQSSKSISVGDTSGQDNECVAEPPPAKSQEVIQNERQLHSQIWSKFIILSKLPTMCQIYDDDKLSKLNKGTLEENLKSAQNCVNTFNKHFEELQMEIDKLDQHINDKTLSESVINVAVNSKEKLSSKIENVVMNIKSLRGYIEKLKSILNSNYETSPPEAQEPQIASNSKPPITSAPNPPKPTPVPLQRFKQVRHQIQTGQNEPEISEVPDVSDDSQNSSANQSPMKQKQPRLQALPQAMPFPASDSKIDTLVKELLDQSNEVIKKTKDLICSIDPTEYTKETARLKLQKEEMAKQIQVILMRKAGIAVKEAEFGIQNQWTNTIIMEKVQQMHEYVDIINSKIIELEKVNKLTMSFKTQKDEMQDNIDKMKQSLQNAAAIEQQKIITEVALSKERKEHEISKAKLLEVEKFAKGIQDVAKAEKEAHLKFKEEAFNKIKGAIDASMKQKEEIQQLKQKKAKNFNALNIVLGNVSQKLSGIKSTLSVSGDNQSYWDELDLVMHNGNPAIIESVSGKMIDILMANGDKKKVKEEDLEPGTSDRTAIDPTGVVLFRGDIVRIDGIKENVHVLHTVNGYVFGQYFSNDISNVVCRPSTQVLSYFLD